MHLNALLLQPGAFLSTGPPTLRSYSTVQAWAEDSHAVEAVSPLPCLMAGASHHGYADIGSGSYGDSSTDRRIDKSIKRRDAAVPNGDNVEPCDLGGFTDWAVPPG
jgi:hypothetical protein